MIRDTEILVVGGGPAGLCAAQSAASLGAQVLLLERDYALGGQLVKQTHKFFGSEKQHAGERGFQIGADLLAELQASPNIQVMTETTVLGYYEDGIVTALRGQEHWKLRPKRTIITTGAAEKFLAFPGNDLPGVYGAGAVQTLMNVAGVKPAERVLMVGSGNIGLIVSYQLRQAGVEVAGIVEAAPRIGGYLVHAAKIRRAGIPILTGHTIKEVFGRGQVEGAVICQLDERFKPVPGTERTIVCDAVCLAVGLTPLTELCWQAGCEMKFVRELSGHVPVVDGRLETTVPGLYAAGDVTGIEEASSAMGEGRIAGCSAAESLGLSPKEAASLREEALRELSLLRAGPAGEKIHSGIEKLTGEGGTVHVNLYGYSH